MKLTGAELADDQTGQIRILVEELAAKAATHKDFLIYQLPKNGETAGFNAFDGKPFFAADHVSGASGAQSNKLTFTAASVQDDVREDIRDDDIERESRTVTQQIIRPMVELAFPGRGASPPVFRRVKPKTVDRIKEADLFFKAQQIGMEVPEDHARERLGIPKPAIDDKSAKEPVLEAPESLAEFGAAEAPSSQFSETA